MNDVNENIVDEKKVSQVGFIPFSILSFLYH